MFYSFVKYAEWTVVIVVPDEIIYHNGNVLAWIILMVFLMGLVVIYFLCHHFLKRNTLKPLKRFVTAADQVAKGRFDIELPEGEEPRGGRLANGLQRHADIAAAVCGRTEGHHGVEGGHGAGAEDCQ